MMLEKWLPRLKLQKKMFLEILWALLILWNQLLMKNLLILLDKLILENQLILWNLSNHKTKLKNADFSEFK